MNTFKVLCTIDRKFPYATHQTQRFRSEIVHMMMVVHGVCTHVLLLWIIFKYQEILYLTPYTVNLFDLLKQYTMVPYIGHLSGKRVIIPLQICTLAPGFSCLFMPRGDSGAGSVVTKYSQEAIEPTIFAWTFNYTTRWRLGPWTTCSESTHILWCATNRYVPSKIVNLQIQLS